MSNPKDRNYAVGKGRPPVHSRFRPGQSGNPSGRPKRPKSVKASVWEALGTKVTVVDQGRKRRITKLEYIFNKLANDAAQGKPHAVKALIYLVKTYPAPENTTRNYQSITKDMTANEAAAIWLQVLKDEGCDIEL